MNEKIKQFADKIWAEEYWDNPATDKLLPAQLNKFAELIVEKCAAIIESQDVDPSFKLRMSWAVKQYFGVEE
jgi:hypothetical protein